MTGNVDAGSILQYVGLGLTVLFVVFIAISLLKSLSKRLGKNITNLVCMIVAIVLTFVLAGILLPKIYEVETVKGLMSQLVDGMLSESGEQLQNIVVLVQSFALLLIAVLVTPILFIACLIVTKIIALIIVASFPGLKKLVKRKQLNAEGKMEKVKIGGLARVAGLVIGVVVGAMAFFAVMGPTFAILDLTVSIINEVPEAMLELDETEPQTANVDTGVSFFAEEDGPQQPEEPTLAQTMGQVFGVVKHVKQTLTPLSESAPFAVFRGLGVNNLYANYLDNASSIEYEMNDQKFKTTTYTDLQGLGKGVVIFGSYMVAQQSETLNAEELFPQEKLEEGVHGILRNNFIIGTVTPIMQETIGTALQEGLNLSEEEAKDIAESIKLDSLLTMTESEKKEETKQITAFITTVMTADMGAIAEDPLANINTLGEILDTMSNTESFGDLPSKTLPVVVKAVNSDESEGPDLSGVVDTLIQSVENGDCNYTETLNNIKSAVVIAQQLSSDKPKTEEEKEQFNKTIEQEFLNIFDYSNPAIKNIIISAIEGLLGNNSASEQTKVMEVIVKGYLDNLYTYAEELKASAGTDATKLAAAKEEFKKESKGIMALLHVADDTKKGESISEATVQELVDAVLHSEAIERLLIKVKDGEGDYAELKNQFKEFYNKASANDKTEIAKNLQKVIDDAKANNDPEIIDLTQNINLLRDILGISYEK